MPFADHDDIRICYDTLGDAEDPPLLLVAGLGNQLVTWQEEFCAGLVDRGFFVIRYDHRDCGLSTILGDHDEYSLHDMAGDAAALLDALGIERTHVFGHSLGGMIAQVLALESPGRVATMTLLSTATGNWDHGAPTEEALAAISRPHTDDRDESFEQDVANRRLWSSPSWFDEERVREQFRAAYDRSFTPTGSTRQFRAITQAPDREDALRALTVPTLVMHGTLDPLIGIDGGRRLASLLPEASFVEIEGLAHDLPMQVWQQVISAVTSLVAQHAS